MKVLIGLIALGLLFRCFVGYSFQNVMFPATMAAAADQAGQSIPGYEGQIASWMLSGDTSGSASGSPYASSVLTPFDGYSGPTGFYSCGPYFMQTNLVVITSLFHDDRGWDNTCKCERYHTGIDYGVWGALPPLLAPISGKVVFAGWSTAGYGNLVVIENQGVRVYLAHLSLIGVAPGQIVTAGDQVGVVGTTGNSTGPHLHFEVRIRDPLHDKYGLIVDPSTVMLPGQTQPCDWLNGGGLGYIWKLK